MLCYGENRRATVAAAEHASLLTTAEVGAIPPFSFHPALSVLVDDELCGEREIVFNAGRLDRSIQLVTEDYLRIAMLRRASVTEKTDSQRRMAALLLPWSHILLLTCGGLAAGIVDTIVGGGGMFTVPALFLVSLPAPMVLGTNQFALSFGALTGTVRFAQSRSIKWWPETAIALGGSVPGAILGGVTAITIPPAILHIVIIGLLAMTGLLMLGRKPADHDAWVPTPMTDRRVLMLLAVGGMLGFYEGFFGPGTGLLITFAFVTWFRFSYLMASGTAKVLSLFGNVVAFLTYAVHGDVRWELGLIMAVSVAVGAYLGARLAHRRGARIIRPMMMGMTGLLFLDMVLSVIRSR
ncbi:TSUP family transporter [Sulfobacillus thermosulfidooxidans]|uniref:TSUP family transporter n=1 Tax=Sulfobacillus thermosulfidooxidans TaxID=28034 RepID=UPI0006B65CF9|nr:TSUP family transporter [Sulfobacillus thermosulfidooxidans]